MKQMVWAQVNRFGVKTHWVLPLLFAQFIILHNKYYTTADLSVVSTLFMEVFNMHNTQKGKLRETKEGEDRAEKQRQQVSTNGQWHVSAVARLSAGAWTAEIFTWRTELIHFKSARAEGKRERARPIFYLLAELRQQHKQLNGQDCMNNVHVRLFILLIHSRPDGPFPLLLFTGAGLMMTKLFIPAGF